MISLLGMGFYVVFSDTFKSPELRREWNNMLAVLSTDTFDERSKPEGVVSGDPADPASYIEHGPNIWWARGPIASQEGGEPVFIADILQDYQRTLGTELPLDFTVYTAAETCVFSPYDPSFYLGHVYVPHLDMRTGLFTRTRPLLQFPGRDGFEPYRLVDVVVTHMDGPVHLLLMSRTNLTLWNLQLAEGVEIGRITMINSINAIANLPDNVLIEQGREHGPEACDFAIEYPWYSDPFVDRVNDDPDPVEELLGHDEYYYAEKREDYLQRVARYRTWFSTYFDGAAFDRRAGLGNSAVVLIGPVPDTPLVHRSLAQSPVAVSGKQTIRAGMSRTVVYNHAP